MSKKPNYKREAVRIAKQHKVPPHIFLALVGAESAWDPTATSLAGAQGLTQLMPGTAKGLGVDPGDPIANLEGGARYLKMQYDRFGSWRLALAAYNAGPGAVQQYGGVPPYTETQRYVTKIMSATPNEFETVTSKPNKQQPTMPVSTTPPPASLLGKSSFDTSEQTAFDNLGRIGRGESPEHTLYDLVDSVSKPAPVTRQPSQVVPDAEPVDQPTPGSPPASDPQDASWGGSHAVALDLASVAEAHGLQAVSEKRDRKKTSTGGISDHYIGNKNAYAFDLSNGDHPTPEMDAAAIEVAARLGIKYDGKRALVVTKTVNGYRIQLLYRTSVGGNHYNHLHIGVKKIGG